MQLTNFLFAFSGLVAGVLAGPLEERASSKCVTYAEGSLTTGNITTPQYQKLSFNSNQEVAYYAAQNKAAIHAQFQVCTPNWAGASNKAGSTYLYGRIYIPSSKSCLAAVGTDDNTNYPYPVKAVPCLSSASGEMKTSESIPQNFAYVSIDGGKQKYLEWTGTAKAGFATHQNGCPGGLGYLKVGGNNTLPSVGTNNRISVSCIGGSNFQSELFAELH